jgi:hypothetical protein
MEDQNNMCHKIYACGICDKEYATIAERSQCECNCIKRVEEEAKKAAEVKKKEEQQLRKAAVDEAFENLHRLITAYVKDYGHYEYSDGGEDTNFHWPSRLWHGLW